MKIIGYIGINRDKQDFERQENLLLKVAQQHSLQIDEFMRSRFLLARICKKGVFMGLLKRLNVGDVLLVAELSRLGRNTFGVINNANALSENGVEIVFVQ